MFDHKAKLFETINSFLDGRRDAETFEKMFTDIMDFEQLQVDAKSKDFFSLIRTEFERYTFSNDDLKNFLITTLMRKILGVG